MERGCPEPVLVADGEVCGVEDIDGVLTVIAYMAVENSIEAICHDVQPRRNRLTVQLCMEGTNTKGNHTYFITLNNAIHTTQLLLGMT